MVLPSSELGYCTTSGGRGGGAPVGGAPGAEPSARAGLWKRGDSLRGADDQPRFTASSVRPISLICQRTRESGRLRTRLPCGAGGGVKRLTASSPTSHPPHPTSRRSRASSALIGGKAARRRRQRRRSGRRQSSRGAREKAKKVLIFRPRPPLTPPDPPPPTHPPVPGGGKVLQGTVGGRASRPREVSADVARNSIGPPRASAHMHMCMHMCMCMCMHSVGNR